MRELDSVVLYYIYQFWFDMVVIKTVHRTKLHRRNNSSTGFVHESKDVRNGVGFITAAVIKQFVHLY